MPILVDRLQRGLFRCPSEPEFDLVTSNAGVLDGRNGLGHFVAHEATLKVIELAAATGVALVGVRNGNYLGPLGFYATLMADAGFLGLAASNSFPKVKAFGGDRPVLGTNPLAFGAPRAGGRPVLLDMATSEAAGSTVRWQKEEEPPGRKALDGTSGAQGGAVLLEPFGGPKGFGLGLMVEILAGALTGAGISTEVGSMYHDFDRAGNNGHLFIAIAPGAFGSTSAFASRMEQLVEMVSAPGEAGTSVVRTPGQLRWEELERSDAEGVPVVGRVLRDLEDLASTLEVESPW